MRKAMNMKYWAICGIALTLAACSDDSIVTPNGGVTVDESGFNTSSFIVRNATRATTSPSSTDFEMPECPKVPTEGLSSIEDTYGTLNGTYVIKNYKGGWVTNGSTIYITGNVEIEWWNSGTGNATIYILPSGTLKFDGTVTSGTTIYNYGNFTGNMTIANDVTIYSSEDMTFGTLGMNSVEEGNECGKIYCKGALMAKDIRLNGEISACALVATDEVTLNDNGTFRLGYITSKYLTLNAAKLILDNNGLIAVDETIYFSNADTRITVNGTKAVMSAKAFCTNNEEWIKNQIAEEIYCWIKKAYVGSAYHEGDPIDLSANSNVNNEDAGWVPATGCHGAFGKVPESPESPETPEGPQLVEVDFMESIENPNHDHNADKNSPNRRLSATCIDFYDGVFYTSYHMRGSNYAGDTYDKDSDEGCIETWTIGTDTDGNEKIQLGRYMWTNEFDFNHLIFDGQDIVTVGHEGNGKKSKGAIIGRLPNLFNNFNATDGDVPAEFKYKYLTTDEKLYGDYENENTNKENTITNQVIDYKNAGDGNCVIKMTDGEYFVATYAGYGKVDKDFKRIKNAAGDVAFVPTAGSAKHIIKTDDGNVAVLYLNNRSAGENVTAEDKSTATIATLTSSSFPFGAQVVAVTNAEVQPIDGKNVLAYDDNKFYACLGKGGLYVNGEVYQFGEERQEPVNGIAIGDDYIYLASGSHLRVLDKDTLEEVTHYCLPGMSANYIKLATINGENYIAVAFGQAGIKVFKLKK